MSLVRDLMSEVMQKKRQLDDKEGTRRRFLLMNGKMYKKFKAEVENLIGHPLPFIESFDNMPVHKNEMVPDEFIICVDYVSYKDGTWIETITTSE